MANSASLNPRAERLWQEANSLLESGLLNQAAATTVELVELLKDQPPDQPSTERLPIHGEALGLLAHIEFLRKNVANADVLFAEALTELRGSVETSRVPLAKALIAYSLSLIERGRQNDARAVLSEAVDALRPAAEDQDDSAFDLLRAVASRASMIEAWGVAGLALESGIDAVKKTGRPLTELAGYYGSLANVRLNEGRAADALEPARESLRLARVAHRRPDEIATAIVSLGRVLLELGEHEEAQSLSDEAIVLDANNAIVQLYALKMQGLSRARAGRLQEAVSPLSEALELATKTSGLYSPDSISVREDLAIVLSRLEHYSAALPHWEFLTAVREAQDGSHSLRYANALNHYANALDQTGEYAQARRHYEKALTIFRRELGETHPDVLRTRSNLAELARASGALELSARQFRELEETWRRAGGTETNGYGSLLLNFGLTLIGLGEFAEAKDRLEQARTLRSRLFGSAAPEYGRVLLALAQLESERQSYAEAALLFEQAAVTCRGRPEWQSMLEAAEFGHACSAINLKANGDMVDRALAILERMAESRGANHPTVGAHRQTLVLHLVRARRFAIARALLEQGDTAARFSLIDALKSYGEQHLRDVVQTLRNYQKLHLSLLCSDALSDAESVTKAYEMLTSLRAGETKILRLRGYVSQQPSMVDVQAEVQRLKTAIVQLKLRGDPGGSDAHAEADLRRYQVQLQEVESQLLDRVGQFRLDIEFLGPALSDLSNALPTDTALVEFTAFIKLDAAGEAPLDGPHHYAAFLVCGGVERVELFDLGVASAVDRLIGEYRDAVITQPRRKVQPEEVKWREPGATLAQQLIGPLRGSLSGIQRLIIVPEGKIGLLPLGSLPTTAGRFLMDNYEISYRFSSRELRRMLFEEDYGIVGRPAVLGAPEYGTHIGVRHEDVIEDDQFLAQFRSGSRFEPLTDTMDECLDIAKLLGIKAQLGPAATEGEVKALDSPEILHISTHGFFMASSESPSLSGEEGTVSGRAQLKDSLDRAGLAFAGANAYLDGDELPPGADDGILYASEVAGLNLMRTDLVTLSACQTGLGDVRSGDGVHGLQRAFTTAGARSVVCSLWEVPDKPTRILFTRFYQEILNKRLRGEALHVVVRELAKKYPLHPIAWGGFVLYGETGVLSRFDPARRLKVVSLSMGGHPLLPETPAQQAEQLIAKGTQLISAGDLVGAIEAFTAASGVLMAPDALRARALYERAGARCRAEQFDEALAEYRALQDMPNIPERLRVLIGIDHGVTYILAGRLEEGIDECSKSLAWPGLDIASRAALLNNRGVAHSLLGHHNEALADVAEVIETPGMPRDQRVKAIVSRAEMYLGLGRFEEAETETRSVLEAFSPTSNEAADAYLILGQALGRQGRSKEAIECFRSVLALDGIENRYRTIAKKLIEEV